MVALDEVDFTLYEGEILGLIGPNGAGKTTCFNAMTGVYRPTEGEIRFQGQHDQRQEAHQITQMGIARTFQNIRLFPEMTALENVMVGADAHHKTSVLARAVPAAAALARGAARAGSRPLRAAASSSASTAAADELARNLPYGDQRRLEIARALATEPKLLCLDEPAAGFNPAEKEELLELIRQDPRHRRHRAADRARHAPGHGRDRPDRGAGVRPEDRRGAARRGAGRPEGDRRLPGGADRCCLRSTTSRLLYGRIQALHGISLHRRRGRDRRADRRQRRRQDHHHAGDLRAAAGRQRARSASTARTSPSSGPTCGWSAGICQSPEGRGIFPGMTVLENLEMGAYTRRDRPAIARGPGAGASTLFPRLAERRKQAGGTLSGGEQQMLAVGRALMSRPKLLLLDEPSMGLAPMLIQQIFDIITEINQQGTTVLLVEQNAQQALSRAHRAYVLETGRIVKSGTGAELLHDPAVKEAYLGVA